MLKRLLLNESPRTNSPRLLNPNSFFSPPLRFGLAFIRGLIVHSLSARENKVFYSYLPLILLMIIALLIRSHNLNYNSPFNDEAIYIVIGKLGLFQGDWYTYNPASWMGGYPLFYPSLTSLADSLGGIIGSRFLNVILGVLTIETVFFMVVLILDSLANQLNKFSMYVGAMIAAASLALSSISIYVSRIATYDMPAFYLFFLSLALLLIAQKQPKNFGKWYFFSALSIFAAVMFKIIIGIYLPFIFIFAYVSAHNLGKDQQDFLKKYFIYPLIPLFLLYAIFNTAPLITFLTSQSIRERIEATVIFQNFWNYSYSIVGLWLIGNFGLILKRNWTYLIALNISTVLILGVHLFSHRLSTLDKHSYLAITFMAITAGVGIANLLSNIKNKAFQIFVILIIFIFFILYGLNAYTEAQKFNEIWPNTYPLEKYLLQNVNPGDKILTEAGASTILSVYDINYPTNVTTFDFFEYNKQSNERAYAQAVKDGFFNLIEIEGENRGINARYQTVHTIVKKNLTDIYKLDFADDHFQVYKRVY